jgi:hypothetical protein
MKNSLVALCLLSAGCTLETLPSNQPDSGVDCSTANPGSGSGSTSGELAFGVGSSFENRDTLIFATDAGASSGWISIGLYADTGSCGSGAHHQDTLGIYLFDPSQQFPKTQYPVNPPDGGVHATVFRISETPDAGVALYAAARSGSVMLASLEPCSLSGSFQVALALNDGGTGSLGGEFNSAYCK